MSWLKTWVKTLHSVIPSPFAVILSAAKDLCGSFAQGKLREESRSETEELLRFLVAFGSSE
jgi:hypothetical protein